jgi:molybdopterin/thiamine biosynthesis adenylyltransferase
MANEEKTVVLVGAGNIGSHLATYLARAGIGTLRIIDRDTVEAKNVATQDFTPSDISQPKALALAERLQLQFPNQRVEGIAADLEEVPLDTFAVNLLLGAVDSRRARQALVSELAWPLGVPVIDGGVGEGLLGRVQVFVPGPDSACLECTWGKEDYRQLAAEYPCIPGASPAAPPTASPAFVGAVVAGIMAAETLHVLAGGVPTESHEIAFDLTHRRFLTTRLRRAPRCRHDHQVVTHCFSLAASARVGELLQVLERYFGPGPVHLEGRRSLFGNGAFAARRFATPDDLQPVAGERLAEIGFVPGDRLRVRGAQGSAFVVLTEKEQGSARSH